MLNIASLPQTTSISVTHEPQPTKKDITVIFSRSQNQEISARSRLLFDQIDASKASMLEHLRQKLDYLDLASSGFPAYGAASVMNKLFPEHMVRSTNLEYIYGA